MFCAMNLFQRGVPAEKLRLYTQGGPRIGNKAFAEYVLSTKVPVTRLINKLDGSFIMPNSNGCAMVCDGSQYVPFFL